MKFVAWTLMMGEVTVGVEYCTFGGAGVGRGGGTIGVVAPVADGAEVAVDDGATAVGPCAYTEVAVGSRSFGLAVPAICEGPAELLAPAVTTEAP